MTTQHIDYILIHQHSAPRGLKWRPWDLLLSRLSILYGGSRYQDGLPLYLRHNTPRIRIPDYYQDREDQEASYCKAERTDEA